MSKRLKLFSLILINALLFLSPSPAWGQRPDTKPAMAASLEGRLQEHRQLIKERFEERKEKIASRQAERREKITENIRDRIHARFEIMVKRMQAAVKRLENIVNRIETRLNKMTATDQPTDELFQQLSTAKESLKNIQDLLSATQAEFDNLVLTSDSPKEGLEIIKDTLRQFVTEIKSIHSQLRDIITQMRTATKDIKTDGT